ncbi:DUF2975 domain-containing protein [Soonwooa sp.]|uniref:DUF2975 domain-containing protein n=1 Tax=Soonwooa sp. TaxID=1938592 RepID=UPI002636D352|nr:DUF2975 domain-containing protein [Soonwooa sp.]
MKNTSTTILSILKLLFTFSLLSACLIFVLIFLMTITSIFNIDIGRLSETNIKLGLFSGQIKDLQTLTKPHLWLVLFNALVISFLYIVLLRTTLKIINAIKNKTPFSQEVSNLLSKTALIFLILGIVSFLVNLILEIMSYEIKIEMNISNSEYFLFAGILYVIQKIYQQGVDLQAETDLTI